MMSNPSVLPSYSATVAPNVQRPANTPYRGCLSRGFQVTGVLHIVAGGLCVVLGIVAIVLKAHLSYVGLPIVFGFLFFTTTGILGVVYYVKPKNQCIAVVYLVMTILSSFFSLAMLIFYSINSALDGYNYDCYPLYWDHCDSPYRARTAVNATLAIIFFLEMVCGIVAASFGCCKACRCCKNCCTVCIDDPRSNSNTVYYAANMGGMPMVAVPDNQCARPIYIAGGSSGTHTQPGQFMYMSPSPQPPSYGPIPTGMPQNQIQSGPGLTQTQSVPHQPGMVQQISGPPPGQASFVQVQGTQGQIQMVPAQSVYPQVMMVPGPQQPGQPPQVQQPTAPSHSAEALPEKEGVPEEVQETIDTSSGQVFDGRYSEQASLI